MRKVLVVVDYQYDFYHPNGALYVPGGETCQGEIEKIIPEFDDVIFTLDYHPKNHCSFTENGGQWPTHCVAGTLGAEVPHSMYTLANNVATLYKGQDSSSEEYGAFNFSEFPNLFTTVYKDCEFTVCGLAGNFCVIETIKNMLKWVPSDKITVYMSGIKFINTGDNYMTEFEQLIEATNINVRH